MDFLGFTLLSIFMALIRYFQPGSLTGISAVCSIPERLQEGLRRDHFGGIIDKNLPTLHSNSSSMNPGIQPGAPSIPTAAVVPTPEPAGSVLNAPFGNLTVSDSVSTVADWDEFDPWYFHYFHDTNQRFDPISNFLEMAGFSNPDPLFIKNSVKITGLLGLSVILVGVGVVISNFWRHLKQADDEVMEFANAVRSKRAFLLHRLDLAAFVLDRQLDQVAKQIMLEQKRVHEELASFRPDLFIGQEVNTFREALELHVQTEVDQQVSRIKVSLRELEEVRQAIPDFAKVRAQHEEFQDMLRQSKKAYGKLNDSLEQIERLSDSLTTRQNKDLPISQDVTVPVQELPVTRPSPTKAGLGNIKTEEDVVGSAENKCHNGEGKRTSPLDQWVMSSARRAMTREEIDNEWKVRRERAMMRRTSTQA